MKMRRGVLCRPRTHRHGGQRSCVIGRDERCGCVTVAVDVSHHHTILCQCPPHSALSLSLSPAPVLFVRGARATRGRAVVWVVVVVPTVASGVQRLKE
mgnify:CR=1 FL=1